MEPRTLVVATRNAHKLEEIRALLDGLPVRLVDLEEAGVTRELVEDGWSFEENAGAKAAQAALDCGEWVLADDSGLEVDALDGRPGIHSARFAGDGASDGANNEKLMAEARDAGLERPVCRFVCVAALRVPKGRTIYERLHTAGRLPVRLPGEGPSAELDLDQRTVCVRGSIEGELLDEPRGEGGFGYDPLFLIPERDRTMAEIAAVDKNRISHRAMAFRRMRAVVEAVLLASEEDAE